MKTPLLRGEGVCIQANMYKYFKNAVIRNSLFTLYYFLPYNGVTRNVYEDDKWRRLYCLLFSMILIIMMLMMKWWSDSNDDPHSYSKHSNHPYQVATSYFFQEKLFALFCNDAIPKKTCVLYALTFLYWLKGRLDTPF